MKLMVTGGAGFIGSEFVRQAIGLGYDVAVIDCLTYAGDMQRLKSHEKDVRFFQGDVSDKDFVFKTFTEFKPDKIVHWAAETHVDRSILNASPFMQTNVIGTHVMLEAAKKFGVHRFVNIATDEVYGELGDNGQFFEDTPLAPNSPYSVSKTSADMLGRAFFRTYGLPVITVRPSNNYGPWQYPEKLVPVVILKALHDKPVPVYSKGENIREWLYVSDCAGAVMNILQKGTIGEIYNVGSGQEKRNIDVVKKILQLVGKPESLIEFVKDRPGHDFRYSLNTNKIEKELSWGAKIKFDEGFEKTVSWYLENINWVEKKLHILEEYWKTVYVSNK